MAKIVIIDDHPAIRDGLALRIEIEPDLSVVGQADDVDEAMKLILDKNPDVAIIDVSLKTGNGIELIKMVKDAGLKTRMLVWSMFEESLYAERAIRAGAMGYINKGNVTGVIVDAIRSVLADDLFLSEAMSKKILKRVMVGKEAAGQCPSAALSDQELQTFTLMGQGLKTAEIAERMQLSPKTVATYRARIKEKLELDDMAALSREAAQWVLENG